MIRVVCFLFICCSLFAAELMKLSEFKDQNVSGWLVSEKLDGIRAYWDGQNLLSRSGVKFAVPSEFVASFPPFALDGELYVGRGKFEKTQSIVIDKAADILAWKSVKFHVFDVPYADGGLLERLKKLRKFLKQTPNENIVIIEQIKVKDNAWLKNFAEQIFINGGEGVVVREPNAAYEKKRSANALKLKKFHDAECKVVAINKGSGKYAKLMGSLTCEAIDSENLLVGDENTRNSQSRQKLVTHNKNAKIKPKTRFKIGSGFSDEMRKNPPKIGEIITYKFQNVTAKGRPRFPVFLRVRKD